MNYLQRSLLTNALFSGISALILIVFNVPIAQWFGVSTPVIFLIIGMALLFFAGTISYEIIHQRPAAILWIIIQDYVWVIGSVLLLLLQAFGISAPGQMTVAIVALIVLSLGVNQTRALSEIDSSDMRSVKKLQFTRVIQAPLEIVWQMISDVANYHLVAPNIDKVKILGGEGHGMKRSCSHGKDQWTETCTYWNPYEGYSFEVDTTAPGYPYPFSQLKGTWLLTPEVSQKTRVVVIFEFQYTYRFYNWLVHPILRTRFSRITEQLLDNWERKIAEKEKV